MKGTIVRFSFLRYQALDFLVSVLVPLGNSTMEHFDNIY
jgi:hypothetical protein